MVRHPRVGQRLGRGCCNAHGDQQPQSHGRSRGAVHSPSTWWRCGAGAAGPRHGRAQNSRPRPRGNAPCWCAWDGMALSARLRRHRVHPPLGRNHGNDTPQIPAPTPLQDSALRRAVMGGDLGILRARLLERAVDPWIPVWWLCVRVRGVRDWVGARGFPCTEQPFPWFRQSCRPTLHPALQSLL